MGGDDSRKREIKKPPQQLQMVWPEDRLDKPPVVRLARDYVMRQYRPGDEAGYIRLMNQVQLGCPWNHAKIQEWMARVLPGGFFIVVHKPTGRIVATAMASHRPRPLHPAGGDVGWIAAAPEHKGKGLGLAVTAAAIARLIAAGYQRIYLLTDDFRLPALKTYMNVGMAPFLYAADMQGRWKEIRRQLRTKP